MGQRKKSTAGPRPTAAHQIHVRVDKAFAGEFPAPLLRKAARAALQHQRASRGSLSIVLTDDETLRRLNRRYASADSPTDVLSFPSEADDPDSAGRYFGDIAVSVPRARAQSLAAGHSLEAELQLLTVHGVLHLLGHDHIGLDERRLMWQAQAAILELLGNEISGSAE